ncbi:hypothetical protein H4R20_005632 [Coemansia guatemalensis]|uniref:Uncharacterized protein n=1 Tax=Coemansia guatemalensis TaxID=2761395 RepID=A0A9W8LQL4_9FUNG|nr:hypothetical protein H4R20_005632 [Coemansia guatemalensis]
MAIRSFFSQAKAKVKRGLAKINKKICPDPFKRQLGPKTWIEVVAPEQNSEPATCNSATLVNRPVAQDAGHSNKHNNKYRLTVNTESFRVPFYATPNVEQCPPEPAPLPKPDLFILHQVAPQENDITFRQLLLERARTLAEIESRYQPEIWHQKHSAPSRSHIEDDVLFYCPEFDHPSADPQTRPYNMKAPIILIAPPETGEFQD